MKFNFKTFCVLPDTVFLCVFYGCQNKQRLFPYTLLSERFYNRDGVCLLRGRSRIFNIVQVELSLAEC